MKLVFLGTGTSVGIPAIGCNCKVCKSTDPRNRRMRPGLYIQAAGMHIVVDTSPDFRQQALVTPIPRVDAVLFTHAHADHVMGFDDIRRFNTIQESVIPVFGFKDTLDDVRRTFDYVGKPQMPGVYRPEVEFRVVDGPFHIGSVEITPIKVEHPPKLTIGFRFDADGKSVGYFPDCLRMPEDAMAKLKNLDVMILDALRHRPHSTHATVRESVETLKRVSARQSYLVHMCHDVDHAETQATLPDRIFLACDGLAVEP